MCLKWLFQQYDDVEFIQKFKESKIIYIKPHKSNASVVTFIDDTEMVVPSKCLLKTFKNLQVKEYIHHGGTFNDFRIWELEF